MFASCYGNEFTLAARALSGNGGAFDGKEVGAEPAGAAIAEDGEGQRRRSVSTFTARIRAEILSRCTLAAVLVGKVHLRVLKKALMLVCTADKLMVICLAGVTMRSRH